MPSKTRKSAAKGINSPARKQVVKRNLARPTRKLATPDVVKFLRDNLGAAVTAVIANSTPRSVSRWVNEESMPGLETEKKLLAAFEAFKVIQNIDAAPVIRSWFIGMNEQLNDYSPAESLAEGHIREVLGAARAYVSSS